MSRDMSRADVSRGMKVAWRMLDGGTMAGTVDDTLFGYARITRVDGGCCTVEYSRLRPASDGDIQSAIDFFANIGK